MLYMVANYSIENEIKDLKTKNIELETKIRDLEVYKDLLFTKNQTSIQVVNQTLD